MRLEIHSTYIRMRRTSFLIALFIRGSCSCWLMLLKIICGSRATTFFNLSKKLLPKIGIYSIRPQRVSTRRCYNQKHALIHFFLEQVLRHEKSFWMYVYSPDTVTRIRIDRWVTSVGDTWCWWTILSWSGFEEWTGCYYCDVEQELKHGGSDVNWIWANSIHSYSFRWWVFYIFSREWEEYLLKNNRDQKD